MLAANDPDTPAALNQVRPAGMTIAEGERAALAGIKAFANPHRYGPKDAALWMLGWWNGWDQRACRENCITSFDSLRTSFSA